MKEIKVRATMIEEMLGSQPGDPDLHKTYIASKAPDALSKEEEIAAMGVDEFEERAMTYFHRTDDNKPCLMNYQVKGFFKSAARVENSRTDSTLKTLTSFKKKVDLFVFVYGTDGSRFIPIDIPEGGKIGYCGRPLRANTMQGERVSIAKSESVPAGSTVEFVVKVLDDSLLPYVKAWLDYGRFNGFGQWRNSGKGSFTWEEIE